MYITPLGEGEYSLKKGDNEVGSIHYGATFPYLTEMFRPGVTFEIT